MILDEATSHLDTESEALIAAAAAKLMQGRTTLIIAHRLGLAAKADHIVVMDNGRVIQRGSHQNLLSQDGLYRKLHESYGGDGLIGEFQL